MPDNPVGEDVGTLVGERQDGHPAHRVADENKRPLRCEVVQDLREVLPKLVDVAQLAR